MHSLNNVIQSSATELLQAIVARGEIDSLSLGSVEAAVIGKLYFAIHTRRLDIQNKLLHLLHSIMSVVTLSPEGLMAQAEEGGHAPGPEVSQEAASYPLNPLLTQALVDGISTASNRPVLQHWLDFVLMAVPQFQPALQPVVLPLIECICHQLQLDLDEVLLASSESRKSNTDFASRATDAEFIMLLNGLERLILLSLAYPSESSSMDDDTSYSEKAPPDASGILGNVFGVFGSDGSAPVAQETLTVSTIRLLAHSLLNGVLGEVFRVQGS